METTPYIPTSEKSFCVGESFIREAHAAACPEWKKRIENQFPGLFEGFHVGQRLRVNKYVYIIARIGPNKVILINTENGNYLTDSIEVSNDQNITREELTRNWYIKEFELIK